MTAREALGRVGRAARWFFLGPPVLAVLWAAAAYAAMVWTWGQDPLTFPSPDEAVNRFAAKLIAERGSPFLRGPFTDVEDLAHPRFWLTLGDKAVPAYAPTAFYLYAFLTRIPRIGLWLIPALPASGVAAFTLGTARMLPKGRKWLAVFAPAFGFPGFYWLIRPWVNISTLLVCLCWAFFAWATWRNEEAEASRKRWLVAAFALVGAGAAIRPDYAAYLMTAMLLFALAEARDSERRLVFLLAGGAGVAALGLNLILNYAITGQPLRAAYQIYASRQPDDDIEPVLPGILGSLIAPMGLLHPAKVWELSVKYVFKMRPLGLLALGQAALVPLFLDMSPKKRRYYGAAIGVVLLLALTRLSDAVFGSKVGTGWVHHSVPRYLSPVFLFAALPPLLFLGRRRLGPTLLLGTWFAAVLAVRSGYEVYSHQNNSLRFLHDLVAKNERILKGIRGQISSGSFVYTNTQDKLLWAHWRVGILGQPAPTVASMRRALDANLPVYVVQNPFGGPQFRKLGQALKAKGLRLTRIDAKRGVYRLEPIPP